MKMTRWVVAGIAVAVAAVVSGCSGSDRADLAYPTSQQEFSSLNSKCKEKYAEGLNDIQRSLAFNQCNKDRLQFSKERKISAWVGEITDISTDQGADVVSVEIMATIDGFDMSFGTVTNRVSDYATDSMITPKNPLFNVLAQMKEGDMVSFDASFLPHPESSRGLWESSLTEQGSMDEPEFSIRFVHIRPYETPAAASTVASAAQPRAPVEEPANVVEKTYEPRVQEDESESTSGSGNHLQSLVGRGYGDVKLELVAAGFVPESGPSDAYPHEIDGNPGYCGNAGCSIPWVRPGSGESLCIGLELNDDVDESLWEASVSSGECD